MKKKLNPKYNHVLVRKNWKYFESLFLFIYICFIAKSSNKIKQRYKVCCV